MTEEFEAEKRLLDNYKCEPKVSRWLKANPELAQRTLLEINTYHLAFGIHWFPTLAMFCATHDKEEGEYTPIQPMQLCSIHRYQLEEKGINLPAHMRNCIIERCLLEMVRAMRSKRKEVKMKTGKMVLL